MQPTGLPGASIRLGERRSRTTRTATLISPRFDRLLFFDVINRPTENDVRMLEASTRTLERLLPVGPRRAAVHRVGWGPHYFEHVLGVPYPDTSPKGLVRLRTPDAR